MANDANLNDQLKRAEKHVNQLLSYGGISTCSGPFGSTLEYRYHDGDLEDEIGHMRRLAEAFKQLADVLEFDAKKSEEV